MTPFADVRILLTAEEGKTLPVGDGIGARLMICGEETGQRFALVEHPLAPGFLAAPMHVHHNEDEYSYVLEGEVGLQIGNQTLTATAGTLVFKPRGIPHTFWNPGPKPARLLEIISPAGFEHFFEVVGQFFPENSEPDISGFLKLCHEYGLEMNLDSVPELHKKYNLQGM